MQFKYFVFRPSSKNALKNAHGLERKHSHMPLLTGKHLCYFVVLLFVWVIPLVNCSGSLD